MAQLRKITPSPVLSNFRQAAPTVGYGFRVLAEGMRVAQETLHNAAIQEQTNQGTPLGYEMSGGAMPSGGPMSISGINESLARTESGGSYSVVNSEGYTGKYQWGQARLDDYNRANGTSFTLAQFRDDPALQERAQAWHVQDIVSQTGDLVGRAVNGVTMTPAAIVAMAHLGGIGGARKYVETNGAYDPADSNGTHLSDYARTHGGADVLTGPAGSDSLQGGSGDDAFGYRPFDPLSDAPTRGALELIVVEDGEGNYFAAPSVWVSQDGTPITMTPELAARVAKQYEQQSGFVFRRFDTKGAASGFAKKAYADALNVAGGTIRLPKTTGPAGGPRPPLHLGALSPAGKPAQTVISGATGPAGGPIPAQALGPLSPAGGPAASNGLASSPRPQPNHGQKTVSSPRPRPNPGAPSAASFDPSPEVTAQPVPTTTVRKADGSLESRLFSPAFGPYQEAFNAAAQTAYQSDMMVKGAADIMAMSAQFPLDPEGFAQAAQGYVSQVVSGAPEMFRADLQAEMQQEVQRRYLGIMADRQDDIRQRADNSSSALVEMWSGNLASAIATGNPDEIAAAQEKLDSILIARESLPGVGWTPAQSELTRQRAINAGEAERERRREKDRSEAEKAQAEVQRRTDASTQALTELWGDRVATALSIGDTAAAMKAQAELDRVLAQREASPGAIWTPAQSEVERQKVIAKGRAMAAAAASKAAQDTATNLDRAISTAKAGGMEPEEAILLADPQAAAQFPEKVATLAALAELRATLPTFTASPKAEREAQIAAIGTPDNAGEVQKKKALEDVNREINGAFMKDPIAAAATYLPEPPPPIPSADTAPEDAVPMLQARKAYADRLVAEGYAPKAGYLSAAEAETVGSLLSKEAPIEARLLAAELLTKGFGEAAPQVFAALKNVDPTTKAAGMMSAATGNRDVAMAAMTGRAMLDAGQSKARFTYAAIRTIDPSIASALSGLPVPESDILALAAGIFAYENPEGFSTKPEDKPAMDKAAASALNRALGMSKAQTGEVTGGVQNVMGFNVLLPVGVSGKAVEEAFGYHRGNESPVAIFTQGFLDMFGGGRGADFSAAGIGSSAGSVPMAGGIPLTPSQLASGNIALMPVADGGPTAYRMMFDNGTGYAPIRDKTGGPFIFDIEKLIAQ